MDDARHTAIHEAGHAVIGRVLTMVCGDASVVADDDSAGHSVTADPMMILDAWDRRGKWRGDGMGTRSVFVGRILTLMAGAEAEEEILGRCEGGDADDRYWIGLMLHEIEPEAAHDALEARLRRAARSLARRHRSDIVRVAASLASKGAMTGEEIDAMLPPGFMARPDMWSAPGPAASPEGLAG